MALYDAIILGAGIAGASLAEALTQKDQRVLVLEKDRIASGASKAAGAFLSPKISKPSYYKEYLNRAFTYTTHYYANKFPSLLMQCGLLKYPLDSTDQQRLHSYEPYIDDLRYEKRGEHYFFPDAGIIEPTELIQTMLQGVEVKEQYEATSFQYHHQEHYWQIDRFRAKRLIIATPNIPTPFQEPYLKLRSIGGYRYGITTNTMEQFSHNRHKACSISPALNGRVIIGASHHHRPVNLSRAAQEDSANLLQKAREITPLEGLQIIESAWGVRRSTNDYLPILGRVIDANATLQKYPYIATGAKVPETLFIYHPNLYIHTALASRGFVTAPYNAQLLVELMEENQAIDAKLSPTRLFLRWARKEN